MPIRKSHEQFVDDLQSVSPSLKAVGVYKGCHSEIDVCCSVCGYVWSPTPHNLLSRKSGCPRCSGLERKTTEVFKDELMPISPTIKVVGEYTTSKMPIDVSCVVCNHTWSPTPNNLLRGSGCPECNTSGYKKSEIASFYIYEIEDAYGFGVTNDMWERDRTHRRTFRESGVRGNLWGTFKGYGSDVLELEKQVKKTLPTINLNIDGFRREGLSKANLPNLLKMVLEKKLHNTI